VRSPRSRATFTFSATVLLASSGERRVDVEILVQRDAPAHTRARLAPAISAGSTKRSSRKRTTASSRKSRWAGTGPAEQGASASRGMSTPLAMVSPARFTRNPGVHFEASAGWPARVAPALDIGHVRQAGGTREQRARTPLSRVVDRTAADETPESDPGPDPGTEAMTWPPASARTSTEYSSPAGTPARSRLMSA